MAHLSTPIVHGVDSVSATVTSAPYLDYVQVELAMRGADGSVVKIPMFIPRERLDYAKRLADAINAVSLEAAPSTVQEAA